MVNGSVAMVEFLTFVDANEKNLVVMYVKILILNIIINPPPQLFESWIFDVILTFLIEVSEILI